jgi:hypothetical protein
MAAEDFLNISRRRVNGRAAQPWAPPFDLAVRFRT